MNIVVANSTLKECWLPKISGAHLAWNDPSLREQPNNPPKKKKTFAWRQRSEASIPKLFVYISFGIEGRRIECIEKRDETVSESTTGSNET